MEEGKTKRKRIPRIMQEERPRRPKIVKIRPAKRIPRITNGETDSYYPTLRCNPGNVVLASKHMSKHARDRVEEIGFGKFLRLKAQGLGSRELPIFLLDRAKVVVPDRAEAVDPHRAKVVAKEIVITIKAGVEIRITREVIDHVFEMPKGSNPKLPARLCKPNFSKFDAMEAYLLAVLKKYPMPNRKNGKKTGNRADVDMAIVEKDATTLGDKDADALLHEFDSGDSEDARGIKRRKPSLEKYDEEIEEEIVDGAPDKGKRSRNIKERREIFTPKNILSFLQHKNESEIKEAVGDSEDMEVKFYMLMVLHCILLPPSSNFSCASALAAVQNLDNLKTIDWRAQILYNLVASVEAYRNSPNSSKPTTITGCLFLLMVVFLDSLVNNYVTRGGVHYPSPRSNQYDKDTMVHLARACKDPEKKTFDMETFYSKPEHFKKLLELERGERSHDQNMEVYQKYVIGRTRDQIVIDIFDYRIAESLFVECFKPHGYMDSFVVDLQCFLLSKEWEDKVVLQTKDVKGLHSSLEGVDLKFTDDGVKKTNLNNTVYYLDSKKSKTMKTEMQKLASNMLQYLKDKHGYTCDFMHVDSDVNQQRKSCDCGFHLLLFLEGFETGDIYNIDEAKVENFRIQLAVKLLLHPDNLRNPTLADMESPAHLKTRQLNASEDILSSLQGYDENSGKNMTGGPQDDSGNEDAPEGPTPEGHSAEKLYGHEEQNKSTETPLVEGCDENTGKNMTGGHKSTGTPLDDELSMKSMDNGDAAKNLDDEVPSTKTPLLGRVNKLNCRLQEPGEYNHRKLCSFKDAIASPTQ
ncbi:hypothetical protein ACP70R_046366 [Stipagrostis hirtigluma subsp. patula]